jgi:hypothetical protein
VLRPKTYAALKQLKDPHHAKIAKSLVVRRKSNFSVFRFRAVTQTIDCVYSKVGTFTRYFPVKWGAASMNRMLVMTIGVIVLVGCHHAPDLHVTRHLREAAKPVDIELMDHIIIGSPVGNPAGRGYFSFREAGYLAASSTNRVRLSHRLKVVNKRIASLQKHRICLHP